MTGHTSWDKLKAKIENNRTPEEQQDYEETIQNLQDSSVWVDVDVPDIPRFHNFFGNQRNNPNYQDAVEVRITRLANGRLRIDSPPRTDHPDPAIAWFEADLVSEGDYVSFLAVSKGNLIVVEASDAVAVFEDDNYCPNTAAPRSLWDNDDCELEEE